MPLFSCKMIKGLSQIIHKIYYRGCHEKKQVGRAKQHKLIEYIVAGTTARCVAGLLGVNRKTATYYYQRLREIIVMKLAEDDTEFLCGDIEVDVSEFKHC